MAFYTISGMCTGLFIGAFIDVNKHGNYRFDISPILGVSLGAICGAICDTAFGPLSSIVMAYDISRLHILIPQSIIISGVMMLYLR